MEEGFFTRMDLADSKIEFEIKKYNDWKLGNDADHRFFRYSKATYWTIPRIAESYYGGLQEV
jgi:hypothetical protein